jgi:uncharacterized membrane protein
MKTLANTFFKGLLFTLPLVITFGLIYWLFATAETLLKIPLQFILPDGWYITGMGVISAAILIFCVGLLVQVYVLKFLFRWLEQVIESIPLVKTLYNSARDLIHFFAGDNQGQMSKVVCVTIADGIRVIGFVTNEHATLGEHTDLIAVYIPNSYQVGGHLVYLPKDRCELLNMPVKAAMQQVLTAHVKRPQIK